MRSARGSTRLATTGDPPPAERPGHLGRAHLEGRWHESEAHVCHYSAYPGEERGDQAIPLDRPGTLRAPRDDKRLSLIQNSRREEMHPTGTGPVNYAGLAADMRCRRPRLRLVPAAGISPP